MLGTHCGTTWGVPLIVTASVLCSEPAHCVRMYLFLQRGEWLLLRAGHWRYQLQGCVLQAVRQARCRGASSSRAYMPSSCQCSRAVATQLSVWLHLGGSCGMLLWVLTIGCLHRHQHCSTCSAAAEILSVCARLACRRRPSCGRWPFRVRCTLAAATSCLTSWQKHWSTSSRSRAR